MSVAEQLEARLIALEMLFRGMLAGIVKNCIDPIAEIQRMQDEFRRSAGFLSIEGAADDHNEKMRAIIMAKVDENFDGIRGRVLRDVEIEAARAGRKN